MPPNRRGFTEVTQRQAQGTLVHDFIELADDLRDMLTEFGLRTYRVQVVRIQWTGGKRGKGTAVVTEETLLLPTPKISDLNEVLQANLQSVGLNESGTLELTQISGTYTEEQLRGFSSAGDDIPPDEEFFYEIEFFPQEGPAVKRRFYPASPPAYHPGKLQWSLRLTRSNADRPRTGGP